LFRETTKDFDPRQKFQGDKAYNGEKSIKTPKKKPIKRELTLKEKEINKELASERIFVEHLIRLVKIFRVAQERFRLNVHKYEQIIMTICGLVRLRIGTFVF
jgi:hypothetical protein